MKTLVAISKINRNYDIYITYKKEYVVHKILLSNNKIDIIIIDDENKLKKVSSEFFDFKDE